MATAFLSVASAAASAPLNPAYRQDEFEFYLEDLKAKALIVEAGSESPALRAAEKLGVALITLDPGARKPGPARSGFPARRRAPRPGPAPPRPTTSRSSCTPRAPPRGRRSCRCAQANIWTSARNIASALELSASDRGLIVMPLVPHSRADRRPLRAALARRLGVLHARLQRAQILRRDGGGEAHLVHGRADHASGDPDPRRAQQGDHRPQSAALHPLIVVVDAPDRDRRTRGGVQMPGDRGLWHDRGAHQMASNPLERNPQARLGRPRRRSRDRDHGRGGAPARRGARPARSSFAATTSPRATRTIRRPMAKPSSTAGSAPATRA